MKGVVSLLAICGICGMYGIGSTPVIKDKENKDMFRDSLYWSKACVPGNAVNFFL